MRTATRWSVIGTAVRGSVAASVFLATGAGVAAQTATQTATQTVATDWDNVPKSEFTLFYPGEVSFRWTLDPADGSGPPAGHPSRAVERFRDGGRNCAYCHEIADDIPAADWGAEIVRDDDYLGAAIDSNMRHYTDLEVQGTYDDERVYLRFSWDATGGPQEPETDEYDSAVAFFFATADVLEAQRTGCWATCHDDLTGMPADRGLTMYLPGSRTAMEPSGGGKNYRSESELAQLLDDGYFMEYWRIHVGEGMEPAAGHGYVLEKRNMDFTSGTLEVLSAERDGDRWVVEVSRRLDESGPGSIPLAPGETYYGGIAVHNGGSEGRHHYVSMDFDISVGHPPRGDLAIVER